MINIEKYRNKGWGLAKKEFEILYEYLSKNRTDNEFNVVEFGSGMSTDFLVDVMNDLKMNMKIYSFDDSAEYAYKGQHPNLKLKIVPLLECSDDVFEKMFRDKKYDRNQLQLKTTPLHTRQKNTFYEIQDNMLPSKIDLLLVDGPHGNGRSMAFLRCFERMKGGLVLIDDASHYPFYDHLKMLCNTEMIYEQHVRGDKWDNDGDFVFCKVK